MKTTFTRQDGKVQVRIDGQHVGHLTGSKDRYRLCLLNGESVGPWTYAADARRDIRARATTVGVLAGLASARAGVDPATRLRIDLLRQRYEANPREFRDGVACQAGSELDQALRELGWSLRDGRRFPR